jgi:hypothetical protein
MQKNKDRERTVTLSNYLAPLVSNFLPPNNKNYSCIRVVPWAGGVPVGRPNKLLCKNQNRISKGELKTKKRNALLP